MLQADLQHHLALCLPGLASAAPAAPAAAVLAKAAAEATAAAAAQSPGVQLRVRTQAPPSEPRAALRPGPGSSGNISRRAAKAFFSTSRPRSADAAPAAESSGGAAAAAGRMSAAADAAAQPTQPPAVEAVTAADADAAAAAASATVPAHGTGDQAAEAGEPHQAAGASAMPRAPPLPPPSPTLKQWADPVAADAAPVVDATMVPPHLLPQLEAAQVAPPLVQSPAAARSATSPPAALQTSVSPTSPPQKMASPHVLDEVCAAACRAALRLYHPRHTATPRCAHTDSTQCRTSALREMADASGCRAPDMQPVCC